MTHQDEADRLPFLGQDKDIAVLKINLPEDERQVCILTSCTMDGVFDC